MSDLAERVEQVKLLLASMDDAYPRPRALLEPDSGPAASRYVPCEPCKQTGEVRTRRGWMLCLVCDGNGWRRRRHGDEPWDRYLELRLVEAAELPREPTTRRLVEPANQQEPAYGWERALRLQDRHGSYQAVRRALVALQEVNYGRARLVRQTLVDGEPRQLSDHAHLERELGLVWITLRVGTVRVPPWLIEKPAQKQVTIESLASDGFGAGEIARRLGIPKRTVRKHLARSRLASAGPPGRDGKARSERAKPALHPLDSRT
jgi:hypothetical protein